MGGPVISRMNATRSRKPRWTITRHDSRTTSRYISKYSCLEKVSEGLRQALQHDVQSLQSLCLTSKGCRNLVQPILYAQGLETSYALKDSPQDWSAILLTRTLLTNPPLAQRITSLSLMTLSCGSDLGKAKIIWNARRKRWAPVGRKLLTFFTHEEQTKLFDVLGNISDILLEYKAIRPKGSLSLELREAIFPALLYLCPNLKDIRIGSVLGPSQPDPILIAIRHSGHSIPLLRKLTTVTLYRWPDITNVYQRETKQQLLYTWDLRDLLQSQSLTHLHLDWIHSRPFRGLDLAVKSNLLHLAIRGLVATKDLVKLLECCPRLQHFEYVVMMDHPGQEWDSRGLVPALSEVSQTLKSLALILPPPTTPEPGCIPDRHQYYVTADMVKDDHQGEEICSLAPFSRLTSLTIDIQELAMMAARTKNGLILSCLPPNIEEIKLISGVSILGACDICQYESVLCATCEEDSILSHLVEELLDEGLAHHVPRLSKIYVPKRIDLRPNTELQRPSPLLPFRMSASIEIVQDQSDTKVWEPMQIVLSDADIRTETEDYQNNMHHVQDGGFEPPSEDSDEEDDG
ncbi:hypothetical protein EJ05DRAFT_482302 [Pseudovirgaria hyperparasitica]|uniref:Uncharacterized protein n=1 Tax=Pseudovirgaria hyperparasitica TaxID=470096 RepID=A0A6A6WMY6_9PEZI|nr:uncharacterized protein EJ05DRAFT_482302 [Pseudovirgaria hyperparasitica]KAF2763508.1 hypothetical protein EJ05DRAFT_482302 [Pseudovirgaria hyperparasitica]